MQSFDMLYSWLESWHQSEGYGGFLHHAIHGTVNWEHAKLVPSYTYEPLINGFINLYKKSGEIFWLNKAKAAADDLIRILDTANQFKYSGFEFAPKGGSVVHTINPVFGFMELYRITNDDKYISVCRGVLESVICLYWRGNHFSGPFNMTLMVSAAIAEYCSITNDWRLHEYYGKKSFELVKSHKVGKEGGSAEGLYYRNIDDHSIVFPWYNTVKASAMIRYGKASGQQEWIREGIDLLSRLKRMIVDGCTLPHSFQKNEKGEFQLVDSPMLIAPTAYLLSQLQYNELLTDEEIYKGAHALIERQTSIGFFPSNSGYDWRSKIGVTAWNCFVFEFFSQNYYLNGRIKPVGEYFDGCGGVEVIEDDTILELQLCGNTFISIDKKTGAITKRELKKHEFIIPTNQRDKGLHLTKMWRQQNRVVSYIDGDGMGIWLERDEGKLSAWSPFYVINSDKDIKIIGKHRYDQYSALLFRLLSPLIYKRRIVSIVTRLL